MTAAFTPDEQAWLSLAVGATDLWNRIQVGFRAPHAMSLRHGGPMLCSGARPRGRALLTENVAILDSLTGQAGALLSCDECDWHRHLQLLAFISNFTSNSFPSSSPRIKSCSRDCGRPSSLDWMGSECSCRATISWASVSRAPMQCST